MVQVEEQLKSFTEAFWNVVPAVYLSVFDFQDLATLIGGIDKKLADWSQIFGHNSLITPFDS